MKREKERQGLQRRTKGAVNREKQVNRGFGGKKISTNKDDEEREKGDGLRRGVEKPKRWRSGLFNFDPTPTPIPTPIPTPHPAPSPYVSLFV